jgi:hypothetical protein
MVSNLLVNLGQLTAKNIRQLTAIILQNSSMHYLVLRVCLTEGKHLYNDFEIIAELAQWGEHLMAIEDIDANIRGQVLRFRDGRRILRQRLKNPATGAGAG